MTEAQISVKTVQGTDAIGAWEPIHPDRVGDLRSGMVSILSRPDGAVSLVQDDGGEVFIPVRQVQGVTIRTRRVEGDAR